MDKRCMFTVRVGRGGGDVALNRFVFSRGNPWNPSPLFTTKLPINLTKGLE